MINWNRVNELRDEIGKDDFDEIVDLFLEEVEMVIGAMRSDPDPSKLRDQLHFLKGSALNLGFADFSNMCQAGETTSSMGEADTVDVPAILLCYEQSKQVFQRDMPV